MFGTDSLSEVHTTRSCNSKSFHISVCRQIDELCVSFDAISRLFLCSSSLKSSLALGSVSWAQCLSLVLASARPHCSLTAAMQPVLHEAG